MARTRKTTTTVDVDDSVTDLPVLPAMTVGDAARLLNVPAREVVSTGPAPGNVGTIITTHDGVETLHVPDDRPDGAGQTGLMFWRLPNPDGVYTWPVYTPHPEDGSVDDGDSDDDAAAAELTDDELEALLALDDADLADLVALTDDERVELLMLTPADLADLAEALG